MTQQSLITQDVKHFLEMQNITRFQIILLVISSDLMPLRLKMSSLICPILSYCWSGEIHFLKTASTEFGTNKTFLANACRENWDSTSEMLVIQTFSPNYLLKNIKNKFTNLVTLFLPDGTTNTKRWYVESVLLIYLKLSMAVIQ